MTDLERPTMDRQKAHLDHPPAWFWSARSQSGNIFGFRADLSETDNKLELSWIEQHRIGERLPQDEIPDRLWIRTVSGRANPSKLPDVFMAGSRFVVSAHAAEVLQKFDMGDTQFVPMPLLKDDRETPFAGDWLFCNITPKKDGFEPEESTGYTPPRFDHFKFLGTIHPGLTNDDEVHLNPSVLQGPDIWLDPRLNYELFVSDNLASALRAEKLLGKTSLIRCPIVTLH